MQVEVTLRAPPGSDYSARDLGHLLHKHPDRVHVRDVGTGALTVFFAERDDAQTRAVMHHAVDPVALVRGKAGPGSGARGGSGEGLLAQYVNDRPYAANSLLSVALGRGIGQALSGRSRERPELAVRALPFEIRVVSLAVHGDADLVTRIFAPLGYAVEALALGETGLRAVFDLRLGITARLCDVLGQLAVLVPVLDDAKHYWVDDTEIDKLLARAGPWLAAHPERDLIMRRALKHRRDLVDTARARIDAEAALQADSVQGETVAAGLRPQGRRLHDARLDMVAGIIAQAGARSVLDLGCGEGRLIRRLLAAPAIKRILGVDPALRLLETAHARLDLDGAGEALRRRVQLQPGSLTYADRRWRGFDAAALVEVIEHIEPARLPALEAALFGDARPGIVVVTTPNRAHNAAFAGLDPGDLRHHDHRFEWNAAEFGAWAGRVAAAHGYGFEIRPIGEADPVHGAPSQCALFTREAGA